VRVEKRRERSRIGGLARVAGRTAMSGAVSRVERERVTVSSPLLLQVERVEQQLIGTVIILPFAW
jgi:hypothetical protein